MLIINLTQALSYLVTFTQMNAWQLEFIYTAHNEALTHYVG